MSELKHGGTVRLQTARLCLRPYESSDAQNAFTYWAGDPRVTDALDWTAHKDVSVTQRLINMWVESYQSPTVYHWCIDYQGCAVGDIMVCKWNQDDSWCELGYCLAPSLWGQGLMTEALACVCQYLFDCVGFHRIQLKHEEDNIASGCVMRKCGFQYEGTLRHAKRGRDGVWRNICCYGRLQSDITE